MPNIPTYGDYKVKLDDAPDVQQRIDTNINMFGGNEAKALKSWGGTFESLGETLGTMSKSKSAAEVLYPEMVDDKTETPKKSASVSDEPEPSWWKSPSQDASDTGLSARSPADGLRTSEILYDKMYQQTLLERREEQDRQARVQAYEEQKLAPAAGRSLRSAQPDQGRTMFGGVGNDHIVGDAGDDVLDDRGTGSALRPTPSQAVVGAKEAHVTQIGQKQIIDPKKSEMLFPDAPRRGHLPRIRDSKTWQLNTAKADMNIYHYNFQAAGLEDAARHLRHYVQGNGEPLVYQREQARGVDVLRNAEKTIQSHFENGTFLGTTKQNQQPRRLLTMEDGATITFEDYNDYDVDDAKFAKEYLVGNRDFALAEGRIKMTGLGKFEATREGNTIRIRGYVDNGWKDRYDFHEGKPGSAPAKVLENAGIAKQYDFGGVWRKRVEGTVEILDGKLVNPRFNWQDSGKGFDAQSFQAWIPTDEKKRIRAGR